MLTINNKFEDFFVTIAQMYWNGLKSVYFANYIFLSGTSNELFTINQSSGASCCPTDTDKLLSCFDVDVHPGVLYKPAISISGIALQFDHNIPPRGRVYKSVLGDEAIISYNNKTGALIGTLHTQDGLAFALIKCGVANTYIFEEFNVNSLVV